MVVSSVICRNIACVSATIETTEKCYLFDVNMIYVRQKKPLLAAENSEIAAIDLSLK